MPLFVVIDTNGRLRRVERGLAERPIARAIHAARAVRVLLAPDSGLVGMVNAEGHRDGSVPNAVGSCLLMVLGEPEPGVYAGPIAVVGWDRTTHPQMDADFLRLQTLLESQVSLLHETVQRIRLALDGFDTGRQFTGADTADTQEWDRRVREHGRRVRAASVTG